MPQTLFYIILIILVLDFLFDRLLDYLNSTRWSNELPGELKGIYDEDKYRKSQNYLKENMRFGLLTSGLSFILIIAFLLMGGFYFMDNLVRQYTEHPILMALLFFGIIGLASDLLSTPFDLYHTFVIEEKFGFNRTTPKTYITDKLKGWLLAIILGGGLLAIIIWFFQFAGSLFWLYAWVFLTAFSVFMAMFYSTLIVPLFNKQIPLAEGELRDAIEKFAQKAGFKLDNIFVIDGSKRSSKANAYFSGMGKKKRIVLFDTLIEEHTTEELVGVLAHEIGHYKKKHITKGMIVSAVSSGVMLYLLGLFVNRPELSLALGVEQPSFHIGIIAFGLLYSPVSTLLGIAGNYMSRRHEYQADAFAAEKFKPEPLQEALKKLSVNNLSNLRPHPINVFVNYSHPPLLQRLNHLEKFRTDH
ncbi:MAG: M48 family metallopeptidase [Bacteroidales bacterium]|nr:M48 family metallopeptidase [Bacteroidales bacterium]